MNIACILAGGFEDSELRIPYDRLTAAGHHVDVISAKQGEELVGYKKQEKIKSDKAIADVSARDYDVLLIPGGHSPDQLRADKRFVDFVREMDRAGKTIAAVCHGPQILITAGLAKGRTMTAWTTIQEDLRQVGAKVVDKAVVVDKNFITSRKPEDLETFSREILHQLSANDSAQPTA